MKTYFLNKNINEIGFWRYAILLLIFILVWVPTALDFLEAFNADTVSNLSRFERILFYVGFLFIPTLSYFMFAPFFKKGAALVLEKEAFKITDVGRREMIPWTAIQQILQKDRQAGFTPLSRSKDNILIEFLREKETKKIWLNPKLYENGSNQLFDDLLVFWKRYGKKQESKLRTPNS